MKKESLAISGALFASFLSTLCCLPPLLFLLFGVSIGSFGFLTSWEFLRIPLAVLSIVLVALALFYRNRTQSCSCNQKTSYKTKAIYVTIFFLVSIFLFYPEISMLWIEI
jgi:mercuric ion transport protein